MENKAANSEETWKETYGFKSKHHPSQCKYLEEFENSDPHTIQHKINSNRPAVNSKS